VPWVVVIIQCIYITNNETRVNPEWLRQQQSHWRQHGKESSHKTIFGNLTAAVRCNGRIVSNSLLRSSATIVQTQFEMFWFRN
jgi:hypothetical protein